MANKPSRAPEWRFWLHLRTVKLHEAVALSLNIDPKRLDWEVSLLSGFRQFREGPEFDNRWLLARRSLGDTLPGPVNAWAVHSDDADPMVRLHDFAVWAVARGWTLPTELSGLAAAPSVLPRPVEPQLKPTSLRETKFAALETFIARAYPYGIPAGMTDKEIARRFGAETATKVSERTVRRVRGQGRPKLAKTGQSALGRSCR